MAEFDEGNDTLSRTEHASRNILWAVVGKLVGIAGPFIVRTILIYQLGAQYLGLSGLFTSILQVLSLAELGFAGAIAFSMYAPIAAGDKAVVAALLNYFKKVYRIVGIAILLMGVLLLPFLDYFVKGDIPSDVNIQLAYLIYLINTSLSYFMFAYKESLLNAHQRYDAISKARLISSGLLYVAQGVCLFLFPNYYAYAILLLFATIANNAVVAMAAHRLFPEYRSANIKTFGISDNERAAIRKRVAGLLIGRVCTTTRDSCDGVIMSSFLGLVAVAQYSNYFLIVTSILALLETIGPAITSSVGNSIAIESKEKNLADMRKFIFLYAMPSMVCTACLLATLQSFMELWVGSSLMLPFTTVVLLCAYFYLRTMGDIRAIYIDAAGLWWEQRWRCVVEAVLNLILCVSLVQVFGVNGVCLGTLIALFAVNFCYGSHLLFRYYFGLKYAKFFYLDHALYVGVACLTCITTYCVLQNFAIAGIIGFLIQVLISASLSSAIILLVFFRTRRFIDAKSFVIDRILKRNTNRK